MRQVLPPANATFSASAKTITFANTVPLSLSHILKVVNLTRAVVYYDVEGGSGAGYLGGYSSPVLTLACSTVGHADSDKLFIEYDDGPVQSVDIGGASVSVGIDLDAIEGALGAPANTSATTDTGTFSLIALFKRALERITTVIGHVDGLEGSATNIDGKLPALSSGAVPVIGSVAVRTPTTTSVASSATSVTILASNANRRGFSISNISTAKLYLSFTSPATTANCFIEVPAGAFLLLDQQLIIGNAIYGIWAAANGTAQVTEYV